MTGAAYLQLQQARQLKPDQGSAEGETTPKQSISRLHSSGASMYYYYMESGQID